MKRDRQEHNWTTLDDFPMSSMKPVDSDGLRWTEIPRSHSRGPLVRSQYHPPYGRERWGDCLTKGPADSDAGALFSREPATKGRLLGINCHPHRSPLAHR